MSLWFLLTYIHSDLWASGRNLSIKSIIIIILIKRVFCHFLEQGVRSELKEIEGFEYFTCYSVHGVWNSIIEGAPSRYRRSRHCGTNIDAAHYIHFVFITLFALKPTRMCTRGITFY